MPIFVDPSVNYENTAKAWANHLDRDFATHGRELELCLFLLEMLWHDVYPETLEAIETDPLSFADKVNDYRMALHSN